MQNDMIGGFNDTLVKELHVIPLLSSLPSLVSFAVVTTTTGCGTLLITCLKAFSALDCLFGSLIFST